jgi:hypothetical protein
MKQINKGITLGLADKIIVDIGKENAGNCNRQNIKL